MAVPDWGSRSSRSKFFWILHVGTKIQLSIPIYQQSIVEYSINPKNLSGMIPPKKKHTYTFLIPYCTRLNTFGHHFWFQTWSTLWFQTTCACCSDVIVALSFRAHICCNYKKNMYYSVNCYGFHEKNI